MDFQAIRRKTLTLLSVIVAGVVLVYIFAFSSKKPEPPADFQEIRAHAALVSQDIVDLTEKTGEKIKLVNIPEIGNSVDGALALIRDARSTNAESYKKASELALDLQKLASLLDKIEPEISRQLAYEAIATELALVSELIAYTQNLNTFLDSLAMLIVNRDLNSESQVQSNLRLVNEKIATINKINKEFIKKMEEFDKSF